LNVLVTGSRGLVGSELVRTLRTLGHAVMEYDIRDGLDIVDRPKLEHAMSSCDAVVHSAALLGRSGDSPEQVMAVNIQGTWNVVSLASDLGVGRVIFLSSMDALGIFKGERVPDYLPLDDAHPCYPRTAYGISKRLGEEMCRLVAEAGGPSVVALRPPGVWTEKTYERVRAKRQEEPDYEWLPFWEYGAFIDVRDLASACTQALTCTVEGFRCGGVASSDITTSGRTSREWVRHIHKGVEWRGGREYEDDPYRTLVDIAKAARLLDWQPDYTWARFCESRTCFR